MKRILIAAFAFLSALLWCCAVSAQSPGQGPMVPTAAPGVQANLNAASDPTINNDQTQGYQVGSIWQNSGTGRIWVARSVSTGAAVWTLLELSDHFGYIASNWYLPFGTGITNAGAAPGSGSIRLVPGYIKERLTINAIGVRVTTISGGGNVQAAIYKNNAATGRPTGTALASTSSMSTGSATSVNASISLQVEPGIYWFATNCDNGTAVFAGSASATTAFMSSLVGSATQASALGGGGVTLNGLSVSQTFGSWPDLTSGSFTEVGGSSSIPVVQFEVGSIP